MTNQKYRSIFGEKVHRSPPTQISAVTVLVSPTDASSDHVQNGNTGIIRCRVCNFSYKTHSTARWQSNVEWLWHLESQLQLSGLQKWHQEPGDRQFTRPKGH